jgi:hypothetical protein
LVLVSGLVASVAAREEDQQTVSLHGVRFPGGLADTAREIAFISNGVGVDSIDLRSGRRRWKSSSGIAPLTLLDNGSELVVAGFDDGKMFLVMIESDSGKTSRKWVLSPGVFVSPQTCEIATELHEPILDVLWNVHSRYKGGANLSPGAEERLHIDASGVVEIDIRNGAVVKQERTKLEDLSGKHDWPNDLTELTVGGRVYAIAPDQSQENAQQRLVLVARERATDRVLWEYPLVAIAKASPRQRP